MLEISGVSIRVNFSVENIFGGGVEYLDSKAKEIYDYLPENLDLENEIVILKLEIPKNINKIGGSLLFFISIPEKSPEIYIGNIGNSTINYLNLLYEKQNNI